MNKTINYRFLKIFVVYSLLFIILTGCWSSHEVADIAVIDVMGIDKNEKGEFEITASIVKSYQLYALTSKNSADERGGSSLIVSTTGKSIVQAISKLANSLPKRVYFGHLSALILGDTFASEENLGPGLDFFRRENDFRPNVQLYITKGKAKDIVSTNPELEPTLGMEIKSRFTTKRYSSNAMVKDLSKFSEAISSPMSAAYTGVLSLPLKKENQAEEEKDAVVKQESGEIIQQEYSESTLGLDETAVFKKDKLVGYLNNEETKGLLWLKGDLNEDIIVAPCEKGSSNENISLIIRKVSTAISPQRTNSTVNLDVDIQVEGEISEMSCSKSSVPSKDLEKVNRQFESIVNKEIASLFKKIKEDWNTDIIGFGERINRKYPETWRELALSWNVAGFKYANIDINTDFSITRYGLYKEPTPNEN